MNRIILALALALSVFTLSVSTPAQAQQLTPAQIEQFKKLPRAQQEALARQYGVDLNTILGQAGANAQQLKDPELMGEREREQTEQNNTPLNELDPASLERRLAENDDELKAFGYGLFEGEPTTFAPVTNAPVPNNYLIGAGDNLRIQLYGKESRTLDVTVNRDGIVTLEQLGPLTVAGLRFDEVKDLIRQTVRERMIGMEAVVSMGELRSIQIFVAGEAYKPGAYTVSSLTTMSQALFVSGGVTDIASLRNIQLKRAGETISTFDLYDLLTKGDASDDAQLRNGDVVFIPPRGPMVTVYGEIMRPALYELKGNETLADLVEIAGGLLPTGYAQMVQLQRVRSGERIIETVNLTEQADDVRARGGDELFIPAVSAQVSDAVTLVGAVARPGKYEWREDLMVNQLLPNIDNALLPITDLGYGLIVRRSADRRSISVLQFDVSKAISGDVEHNLALEKRDQVVLFSRYESKKAEENQLSNFLRTESERQRAERERVISEYRKQYLQKLVGERADMLRSLEEQNSRNQALETELTSIFDTQPEAEEEPEGGWSEFSRQQLLQPILYQLRNQFTASGALPMIYVDGEVRYPGVYPLAVNADVNSAIAAAGGLRESAYLARAEITRTILQDGEAATDYQPFNLAAALNGEELVKIKGRDRLNVFAIPSWQDTLQVTLEGEVRFPGTYSVKRGETLSTLIERAGGLTNYAFERGAVFTRRGIREQEQKQLEGLAQQLRREIASNVITDQGGTFEYAEVNQLLSDLTKLDPIGRLVINLDEIIASQNATADVQLKDGDRLFVPTEQNTVSIIGEVQLASSYRFDSSLSVDDYVRRAGGAREKADEDRVYIVKANGAIVVPDDTGWFSFERTIVEPGDTIVVPLDTQYVNNLEVWSTATQIMYQVGVALAAINGL